MKEQVGEMFSRCRRRVLLFGDMCVTFPKTRRLLWLDTRRMEDILADKYKKETPLFKIEDKKGFYFIFIFILFYFIFIPPPPLLPPRWRNLWISQVFIIFPWIYHYNSIFHSHRFLHKPSIFHKQPPSISFSFSHAFSLCLCLCLCLSFSLNLCFIGTLKFLDIHI